MRVEIWIETDGAAFEDGAHYEVARILAGLTAERLEAEMADAHGPEGVSDGRPLLDVNGNACGALIVREGV